MSRRRKPKVPVANKPAPNDGTKWGHLSDAEFVKEFAAELARRRAAAGSSTLEDIETLSEALGHSAGEEIQAATIAALPQEDGSPKPCPKCGKPVPVKVRNRVRHFLTVAGELRISRNYHYCTACAHGFCPRDIELKLPEEGEVSDAMERRILDFGVNTSFEESAQRWNIHYATPISSNLVRRVVDRVGRRREQAQSALALQQACRPSPERPAQTLLVASDGSMLLTREEAWKEAKVAVVARAVSVIPDKSPPITDPRYVAVLGGQDELRLALKAALDAECADDVMNIVWLGDGARENWTMASELCPFAIQILDFMHAVQNGMACGKALLGEADPATPLWEARLRQLLEGPFNELICELLDCLPYTTTDEHLAALDKLVGYYRTNEKRMRYPEFRAKGMPIGSGMVESAHKHVLQVRMKQAGQRWSMTRARRMVQLRALYRTAGPRRFHWAIRQALDVPVVRHHNGPLPNGPRRVAQKVTHSPSSWRSRVASI
jgi:hypothetical protein